MGGHWPGWLPVCSVFPSLWGPGTAQLRCRMTAPCPLPPSHSESHTQPCPAQSPQVWLPRCVGPTVILTATVLLPESLSGPRFGAQEQSCRLDLFDERGPCCTSAYILPWLPAAPKSNPIGIVARALQHGWSSVPLLTSSHPPLHGWPSLFRVWVPIMNSVTPSSALTDHPICSHHLGL